MHREVYLQSFDYTAFEGLLESRSTELNGPGQSHKPRPFKS